MTETCGKIAMSILPRCGGGPNPTDPSTAAPRPEDALPLVCSSGRPFALADVRVVGAGTGLDVLPDSQEIGEVWVRGLSVMRRGYFGLPESSPFAPGGWFRTGKYTHLSPTHL